jgi:hypothetical protein
MVSKFQFYLDGTLVQDPKGWEDLDTTIKRDYTIQGLLITQDSQLEFYGDGYDYIKNKFDNNGFCEFVEVEIKQTCDQLNYERIFKGIIFLADCVFDLMRCSVKCKTVDDGYYAKINNNKNIKAFINVGRSKNDVAIDAAMPITVALFDPSSGTYGTSNIQVYPIYEVFKFIISFMTDGDVDFTSIDFGTGGQYEGQCIAMGSELYLHDQSNIPEISFQDVFTEINKKNRIGLAVETINGKPTVRIESAEYFYSQTSTLTLSNAKGVTMQMDTSQLYSIINLGSSITDNTAPLLQFPEDISFVGFKEETFHLTGTCNVDTTLELVSQWIVSSNVIEQIYVNNVDSHDDEIVLINIDRDTNKAVQSNWLTPANTPPFYYNEEFTNQKVTEKWLGGIPNSIANFLGNSDDKFQAEQTTTKSFATLNATPNPTFGNAQYNDDSTLPNNDPGMNYNITDFYYKAPAAGLYSFYAESRITTNDTSPFSNRISMYLIVFDNLGVVKYALNNANDTAVSINYIQNIEGGVHKSTWSNVVLEKDDRVAVQMFSIKIHDSNYFLGAGSIFSCISTATGGGIYQTIDPSAYKIKKYSFEYPISYDQYKTIISDPKKLITFTTNNDVEKTGWIDELKYFHHSKSASVKLITN